MTHRTKDRFFVLMSGILLVLVLVGFSRTFYLRNFLAPINGLAQQQDLAGYLQLHGVVLTLWFLLAFVQPTLIASQRVEIHRRLGWVNAILAVVLVVTALKVLVYAITRSTIPQQFLPNVLFGDLMALIEFATLVIAAIVLRRNADAHKRLMMLASIIIVGPAVNRIPGAFGFEPTLGFPLFFGSFLALLIAMIVHDKRRLGRIHRATLFGILMIIVGTIISSIIASSSAGRALLERLA
jgi:hypothetical protein